MTQWIVDFVARIEQLSEIDPSALDHHQIWLGGLFQPEAWITATHQAAARKYQLSLEDLELDVQFKSVNEGFKVKGEAFFILSLALMTHFILYENV